MYTILINSDDNMFKQGVTTLLKQALPNECEFLIYYPAILRENDVAEADIIVMNLIKGEERICHKILKFRKPACLLIVFYCAGSIVSSGRLPLCLNGSVFIKRTESIKNIGKLLQKLWSTQLSQPNPLMDRTCCYCPHATLSAQQINFASNFSKGVGTNEIANRMNINSKTVSAHKRQIMLKLNVESECELLHLLRIIQIKS